MGFTRWALGASAALARVRQKAATGLLFDALAHEDFCRDLIERVIQHDDAPVGCGDRCGP